MRQHLPDRKVGKASLTADTGRLRRGYEAPEPGTVGSNADITRLQAGASIGWAVLRPVITGLVPVISIGGARRSTASGWPAQGRP
jgi:hypothetical protein